MAMITTGYDLRMRLRVYHSYTVNMEVGTEELYDLMPGTLDHEQYALLDELNADAAAMREKFEKLISSIPDNEKALFNGR